MQPTLFDNPIAASADPRTSHHSAERVTRTGKRAAHAEHVLKLVRLHPDSTAVELFASQSAPALCDRHEVSRRLADLAHKGLIARGEPRRCSVNGTEMVTWRATS